MEKTAYVVETGDGWEVAFGSPNGESGCRMQGKDKREYAERIVKIWNMADGLVEALSHKIGDCEEPQSDLDKLRTENAELRRVIEAAYQSEDNTMIEDAFRRVIDKFDPMANSPMTPKNAGVKVLADWGRKICNDTAKLRAENAELRSALFDARETRDSLLAKCNSYKAELEVLKGAKL